MTGVIATIVGELEALTDSMPKIRLKRVYEPPAKGDGLRILVERLWPRGLTKEKAALDHWLKEVAPSPELRRWYDHKPERWPGFQERYRTELAEMPEALERLRALCAGGPVTFVYAARDEARNSAVVLRALLSDDTES